MSTEIEDLRVLKAATRQQAAAHRSRQATLRRSWLIVLQIIMTLVLITFLGPTLWMVSSSLKARTEIFAIPMVWLPENPQWGNYIQALTLLPFAKFAVNTFVIAGLTVVGTVLSCSIVAYSFSRLRWPGRDFFFALLLGTMMLPEVVTLIPMFIEFRTLGWTKPGTVFGVLPLNFLPITVPYWLALSPLYVFLMRQFFKGIPMELEEAALMDGASRLQILFRIILPLSKPVIATVAVFSFLQSYNDFLQPLIYLNGQDNWTLALGLRAMNDVQQTGQWELLFAASTAVLLPVLLIFIFAQRYFVQGIATTGFGGR
ncbi:MAG: carbohydrate ABC transporter permease [Chloroflexi bacterium]|nr:carbohydrate ABC transporter permease [Chloroflexota bacterium]